MTTDTAPEPTITRYTLFACQVCAPKTMTSKEIEAWVRRWSPAGTEHNWKLREQGDEKLLGAPERVVCEQDYERVHVMFDC